MMACGGGTDLAFYGGREAGGGRFRRYRGMGSA